MPQYRIRMVRQVLVTEDAYVTVLGDNLEDAMACADEMDPDQRGIAWRRQEAEPQSIQADYSSLREISGG